MLHSDTTERPADNLHTVKLKCAKTRYVEKGEGPVIVMLHGMSSSHYTWRAYTEALSKSFRVVVVNLPGFGISQPLAGRRYTPEDYKVFLLEFCEFLNIDKCILVGHSFGCWICLSAAAAKPSLVGGLFLVSPAVPGDSTAPRDIKKNLMMYAYSDLANVDPALLVHQRIYRPQTPPELAVMDKFPELDASGWDQLKMLHCLIIYGERDRLSGPDNYEIINKRLPQAEFFPINTSSHMVHEEYKDVVLSAMERFLFKNAKY